MLKHFYSAYNVQQSSVVGDLSSDILRCRDHSLGSFLTFNVDNTPV